VMIGVNAVSNAEKADLTTEKAYLTTDEHG
jgi:hypothetical protein